MHHATVRVDQEHPGGEAVENLVQRGGLGLTEIDDPADQHGAPDMRRDEPHPLPRSGIDNAVIAVAKDAEHGHARRRPVEDAADEIDESLRLGPFPIEPRLEKLVIGNHVGRRHGFPDTGEELASVGGIELYVCLAIETLVMRIDAVVVSEGT